MTEQDREISQAECKKYKNVCLGMLEQLRIAASKHHGCPISQKDLKGLFHMMDLLVGRRRQEPEPHPHNRAEDLHSAKIESEVKPKARKEG